MTRESMDKETAKTITECKILLQEVVKDVQELKGNTITNEAHKNLLDRVDKIEGALSKITWAIIMAVLGALLSLVIKGI